jgi:hypothetical protein
MPRRIAQTLEMSMESGDVRGARRASADGDDVEVMAAIRQVAVTMSVRSEQSARSEAMPHDASRETVDSQQPMETAQSHAIEPPAAGSLAWIVDRGSQRVAARGKKEKRRSPCGRAARA